MARKIVTLAKKDYVDSQDASTRTNLTTLINSIKVPYKLVFRTYGGVYLNAVREGGIYGEDGKNECALTFTTYVYLPVNYEIPTNQGIQGLVQIFKDTKISDHISVSDNTRFPSKAYVTDVFQTPCVFTLSRATEDGTILTSQNILGEVVGINSGLKNTLDFNNYSGGLSPISNYMVILDSKLYLANHKVNNINTYNNINATYEVTSDKVGVTKYNVTTSKQTETITLEDYYLSGALNHVGDTMMQDGVDTTNAAVTRFVITDLGSDGYPAPNSLRSWTLTKV